VRLKNLIEEILSIKLSSYKHSEITGNIWKNPTRKELHDAYFDPNKKKRIDTIRFSAFADTKDIYVFPSEFIHVQFYDAINAGDYYYTKVILDGLVKNGKIIESDRLDLIIKVSKKNEKAKKILEKIVNADWNFLRKYFTGVDYFIDKAKISLGLT
jgi:disulfide oxidoreductase YuzD